MQALRLIVCSSILLIGSYSKLEVLHLVGNGVYLYQHPSVECNRFFPHCFQPEKKQLQERKLIRLMGSRPSWQQQRNQGCRSRSSPQCERRLAVHSLVDLGAEKGE